MRRTGFDRGIGMAHPSPCGAVGGCGAVGLARSDARARRPRRFPSVITDSGGNRAGNNDEGWRGRGVRGRERDARGWGPPGEASRVARRAGRRARTPDGWERHPWPRPPASPLDGRGNAESSSSRIHDDHRAPRRGASAGERGRVRRSRRAVISRALSSSQAPAPWDRSRDYDDETDDDERVNPWDLDVDEAPVAPPFNDARVPSWVTLTRARWDKVTTSMASCATVPFLFLTMPQIVKNTGLIAAGRPDALAAISWQGQLAGLLGNMLLLSYFADKGELSASFVQVVGTCATGALLTQMCLAGHIPIAPFAVAAAAVSAGLILSGFRMLGRIGPVDTDGVPCVGNVQCAVSFDEADEEELSIHGWWMRASNGLWDFYTHATGIVGLAALPQIGLMSLMPATLAAQCGVYPGAAGAALGTLLIILNYRGKLPPAVASAWGALSGWTATLLFMSMPVAQLASNFANPQTLEGLSILSALLAMTGNALMVPRALFTRDVIWLTGSTWGCTLMGWGVMLSLFLGHRADGARYIGPGAFTALTALFFAYLVAVWLIDGISALASGNSAGWRLKAWRTRTFKGDNEGELVASAPSR